MAKKNKSGSGGSSGAGSSSPTSSAVVADVVASACAIAHGAGRFSTWKQPRDLRVRQMEEIETQYYIRLKAADQPGVLASIARIFGEQNISIASAIQPESDDKTQSAEIVIMTHPAREEAMQCALRALEKLDMVREISNFIRVEDIEGG